MSCAADAVIAVYRRDAGTGRLTNVARVPTAAPRPRSAMVDPSGRLVLAAHEGSTVVSVFRVDPSGHLTPAPGSPFRAGTDPRFVTVDPAGRFAFG